MQLREAWGWTSTGMFFISTFLAVIAGPLLLFENQDVVRAREARVLGLVFILLAALCTLNLRILVPWPWPEREDSTRRRFGLVEAATLIGVVACIVGVWLSVKS